MKALILAAFLLCGCAAVSTPYEGVLLTGVSRAEKCDRVVVHPNGDIEKFNCNSIESKGISGELASVASLLFRWWPF